MIRLIVAVDQKGGIARAGVQPWKLPSDEAYFSFMTKQYGGIIVMGRTTHEVIGRPLADRHNFVLTSQPAGIKPPVKAIAKLESIIEQHDDVWIIGGAQLYEATINRADELYVTRINKDYGCDTFFPAVPAQFRLAWKDEPRVENGDTFWYERYERL